MLLATLITHFSGVALSNDKLYSYRFVHETPRLFLLYLYNSMSLYLPQVSYTHIIIIIKKYHFSYHTLPKRDTLRDASIARFLVNITHKGYESSIQVPLLLKEN